MASLASEEVGQLFVGGDRVEYTEWGRGDRWVVLLHGQLIPRGMQAPLARVLASEGFHVLTPDLLGHGRSDRPEDPKEYSMTGYAEQVVALLDHVGAPQAVVGGTSLGANVALEVAVLAPTRVRGLVLEMPVLDNGLEAGLLAFAPLLFVARFAPVVVHAVGRTARLVPRRPFPGWVGVVLDTLDQQPRAMAATVHGIFFGRIAPSSRLRRGIDVPALVVGHPRDPIHLDVDARMVADELPRARYVQAHGVLEWRRHPGRLDDVAVRFVRDAWSGRARRRSAR